MDGKQDHSLLPIAYDLFHIKPFCRRPAHPLRCLPHEALDPLVLHRDAAVLAAGFLGGRLIAARKALDLQKDISRMETARAEALASQRVRAAEEKIVDMRAAGA